MALTDRQHRSRLCTPMDADILVILAQSSITLFGFVAVFFIFRYQRIDTYIDNRRPVLRKILRKKIRKTPDIHRRIELIGRNDPVGDLTFFRSVSRDDPTVVFYVREIIKLSDWRADIKRRGMLTIIYLGVLAFALLLGRLFLHFGGMTLGFDPKIPVILAGFILFSTGLVLTISFLYLSFGQKFTRNH